MITIHTAAAVKAKDNINGTVVYIRTRARSNAWPKGGKGGSRGQFLDRLMWEGSSPHAWTEKEEFADLVADKVRSDLGINDELEGSSRSYDVRGWHGNDDDGHVSKSRKLEKRRIHKQKQRANISAKIECYEDLEARLEHIMMESLVRGHFDEDPDRAMTKSRVGSYRRRSSQEGSRCA